MFRAGSFTIDELSRYTTERPLGEQSLILPPNLARLGIGVGAGGSLDQPEGILAIAAFHLVSAAVLAALALRLSGSPFGFTAIRSDPVARHGGRLPPLDARSLRLPDAHGLLAHAQAMPFRRPAP